MNESRQRLVDVLHFDAEPAVLDLAGLDDLILDLLGQIDRNRKRHALVAAGVAVDLRVDADHGAGGIEQRPAGVAGVDGRIGLNEGHRSHRRAASGPWR